MDKLTRYRQDSVPWCMLFIDGVVLIDEGKVGLNAKTRIMEGGSGIKRFQNK